ncbi:MAG: DNA polymerase Y family protein [Candidatus Binatia bacterium]|nr:DNA polymerase Y family protein [Candidatus Binatia bacterium]
MRIACLYVPEFPLAAWLRAEPELRTQAVVVVERLDPRSPLLATSRAAWRWGIGPGMRLSQAQSLCRTLVVRPCSRLLQESARAALMDAASSCSPLVEPAEDGVVYIGLEGLIGHWCRTETQWASQLSARCERLGVPARVAVASTKTAALLAAMRREGVTVLDPAEEATFLAPVPIAALRPSPPLLATLERWGIHTIGQLVQLPLEAVGTRLGPEGIALIRRARGEELQPLQPRPCPMVFEEGMEFDYEIDSLEPLTFVLRALLDRVTARLVARGFACAALQLGMHLSGTGWEDRTVAVAYPNNEVKALLALLRVHLEQQPPQNAIDAVRLRARPEMLRASQLDLFRPPGPPSASLAAMLAQLSALCGSERVGSPTVLATHRLDGDGMVPFGTRGNWQSAAPPPSALPPLALRRFRPPLPVKVFSERERPEFVRGPGFGGRVVSWGGPWRIRTEWWSEATYVRDYYDVQLSDGGLYRLFRDEQRQQWFADGVYD